VLGFGADIEQKGDMGGAPDPQLAMLATLSTEEVIPSDHPIRRIQVVVDAVLAEMDDTFDEMYATPGRSSVKPESFVGGDGVDAPRIWRHSTGCSIGSPRWPIDRSRARAATRRRVFQYGRRTRRRASAGPSTVSPKATAALRSGLTEMPTATGAGLTSAG
jgi:hypothetical protein